MVHMSNIGTKKPKFGTYENNMYLKVGNLGHEFRIFPDFILYLYRQTVLKRVLKRKFMHHMRFHNIQ